MRTPVYGGWWQWSLFPEDPQSKPSRYSLFFNCISPGYFQTLGARLIAGRDFDVRDTMNAEPVIVIDEAAAQLIFGSANPVGRTVKMRPPDMTNRKVSARIIGLVRNLKYTSLSEEPHPLLFVPLSQVGFPSNMTAYEFRLTGSDQLSRVLPLVRAALVETNKDFSLDFQTLDSRLSDDLIQPRLLAAVAGFFGLVALILAATGLYGVIAYSTARRRAELGLRMALGATSANVTWFVLRDIALTLLLGSALGLAASCFAGRLVKSLVFDVRPTDPTVLATALISLVTTAAVAAYIPARRASRLDPMDSLRIE